MFARIFVYLFAALNIGAAFGESESTLLAERSFIFYSANQDALPLEFCDTWSTPYLGEPPASARSWDLYPVTSEAETGEVEVLSENKIGEMFACLGSPYEVPERIVSLAEVGATFLVVLEEKEYFAGGHIKVRTGVPLPDFPDQFPAEGFAITSGTGTAYDVSSGELVGAITVNGLSDPFARGVADYKLTGLVSLRLYYGEAEEPSFEDRQREQFLRYLEELRSLGSDVEN